MDEELLEENSSRTAGTADSCRRYADKAAVAVVLKNIYHGKRCKHS